MLLCADAMNSVDRSNKPSYRIGFKFILEVVIDICSLLMLLWNNKIKTYDKWQHQDERIREKKVVVFYLLAFPQSCGKAFPFVPIFGFSAKLRKSLSVCPDFWLFRKVAKKPFCLFWFFFFLLLLLLLFCPKAHSLSTGSFYTPLLPVNFIPHRSNFA